MRFESPTRSSSSDTLSCVFSFITSFFASLRANSTFSYAVIVGISAIDWNTNPISYRLSISRSFSVICSRFLSRNCTLPSVGISSALRILRSVVFPEPERPFKMASVPFFISMDTPSSAWTVVPSPALKYLFIF